MGGIYEGWLAALEGSGFGHLARHSAWLYTMSNLVHVLGAALLVGGITVFDVSLLRRRAETARAIAAFAIPVAAFGLALQVPSGLVLLAPEATKLGVNPAFLVKITAIALGLLNVLAFHTLVRDPGAPGARITASLSLAAWIIVLAAGRMIAYL
jgi:hypothetical protein